MAQSKGKCKLKNNNASASFAIVYAATTTTTCNCFKKMYGLKIHTTAYIYIYLSIYCVYATISCF